MLSPKIGAFGDIVVSIGDTEIIQKALEGGIDPDMRDYLGRTALHVAMENGQTNFAKLLLSKGADPKKVSGYHQIDWSQLT